MLNPIPPQVSPSGHCCFSGLAKGQSPQPLLLLQPYSARPLQEASFPRGGCSPKSPTGSFPPGALFPLYPSPPPPPLLFSTLRATPGGAEHKQGSEAGRTEEVTNRKRERSGWAAPPSNGWRRGERRGGGKGEPVARSNGGN